MIVSAECRRLGVVLAPDGSTLEVEGVLNPGIARDRDGRLLMYPRMVAAGNVSRIGIARAPSEEPVEFDRLGVVLEPELEYERRPSSGGHGCEDARVTFIEALELYVMTYTAYGAQGARIALAISDDAYSWTRLGLIQFSDDSLNNCDNKDAAFFPAPVVSPSGVPSLALYHRPMLPASVNGQTPIPVILSIPPEDRECMCIAYVPLHPARRDFANLRFATESIKVLGVSPEWGYLKNGAGTPPVATPAGWLSFFHAVDAVDRGDGPGLYYRAGLVVHDMERPDKVLYRSASPLLGPLTIDERFGIVDDVVFPTGIDHLGENRYDVYYGAADAKIARLRVEVSFA